MKPAVLLLIGYYLPGFKAGGPIRSIEQMVEALGDEFRFRIVTADRDLGNLKPYPGVVPNRWVPVGRAEVMYVRLNCRGFLKLWTLLGSVDRETVIYLNSFFDRRFSILPAWMRRFGFSRPLGFIVAPRGEFSPGALGIKRFQKSFYLGLSRRLSVYRKVLWQASSDFEAEDICRQFSEALLAGVASTTSGDRDARSKCEASPVLVAPDIAPVVPTEMAISRPSKARGQLRVVFVSRLSRMKNLAAALRMLATVAGSVEFDIYGPLEDKAYWKECQQLIADLPSNIHVQYRGMLKHEKVARVFAESHLLLLPTLGENFGHVICEALNAGCPVLISDRTPWRNLEAVGAGWDIPLDNVRKFQMVLQQCVDCDEEAYLALSRRARKYAVERTSRTEDVNASRKLLRCAFAQSNALNIAQDA